VVARVRTADQAYAGALLARAPDLVVTFAPGYRASWDSMLGGAAAAAVAPNTERWSAEHASVDESAVPGVWLSTMPVSADAISVLDVSPTILRYFGRPVPPDADGASRLVLGEPGGPPAVTGEPAPRPGVR
jgi:hypothetical protein